MKSIITFVIAAVVGVLAVSAVPLPVRGYSPTTIVAIRSYHYIGNKSAGQIVYSQHHQCRLNTFLCEIGGTCSNHSIDHYLSACPHIPTRLFLLGPIKTIPLADESEPAHYLLS
ncbi:MAG: hypothetical protein AB1489_36830 [Acidobacteriota bacterium]